MTEKKVGIRDYLSKIGPAVIVSMTIIGPGTMSALVTSGSGWYFSFFWAVILSIVFAYVATWISTKLTCVTGLSPVEALKKHTWGWLAWVLVGKVKNGAEPEHPKYETYAARPLAA